MAAVQRIIRKARRRAVVDMAIRLSGRGLAVGACVGCVVLVLDRVFDLGAPIAVYPILIGVGLLIGVMYAFMRRPGEFSTAVRLDRSLRLSDRLGTAAVVEQDGFADDGFAALVRHDAQRVAESIDLKAATPIRITRIWAVGAALVAALGLGIVYLPVVDWATEPPPGQSTVALDEQRLQIIQTITQAVDDLDDEPLDEQTRDDLDALDRLAEQLGNDPASQDTLAEARDQSAARLDEVADRLAEQAQRSLEAADAVAERFAGIDAPDAPMSAEEFTEALQRGEFGEAADLLEQLAEAPDETSPSAQHDVAEHLHRIAEQLEEAQDSAGDQADDRQQQLEEALRDLGVDEQTIDDLPSEQDPQDRLQQALQDNDLDPETVRHLAEDLQRLRDEQEVQDQADRDTRSVAEALKDAAEQLEHPDRDDAVQPPGETPDQSPTKPVQGEPDRQTNEDQPAPGDQQQPGDQRRTEQQPRDSTAPAPAPAPGTRPRPRNDQSGERPSEVTREKPSPDPSATPQPGSPPQSPVPRPSGETQQRPAVKPSDQDGANRRRRSLGEALRKLDRTRREAMEKQMTGERLRQAARELADTLTDEERQRLARQWRSKPAAPPGTSPGNSDNARREPARPFSAVEDLDLRGDDEPDTIIAQWLSKEPRAGEPRQAAGRERVHRAQTAAEQAVEESAVPSRYHTLIQRYFGRLKETVDRAVPKPAPEAPPPAQSTTDDDTS